jgi:two-component system, NarL family, sensor kinase
MNKYESHWPRAISREGVIFEETFGRIKKRAILYSIKNINNVMQALYRFIILIAFTLFLQHNALSQNIINLDSLANILQKEKDDTATLNGYIKKIAVLTNDQIEAKEIIGNWIIKNSTGKDKLLINAKAYQLLARSYARVTDYKKATEFYNTAILLSENNNFIEVLCLSLNGLGGVYRQLDQKPTALSYYKKSLALSQKHNYQEGIALNKFELGGIVKVLTISSKLESLNVDSFNLKFTYFKDALQIWETLKDTQRLIKATIQCAESFANYEIFDSAFAKMEKAKTLLSSNNYDRYYLDYYFISGKVYVRKAEANNNNREDLFKAIDYFNLCYPYAIKYNEMQYKMWYYTWLSSCYEKLNDYKKAYNYRIQYDDLDDSLTGEVNFKQIADIQHKYDRQKKENELLNTKAENKQKSIFNKILIGSAICLILIGLLGYRNFRNKQKVSSQQQELQQKKITELEKDKQLLAIDAMLKGQEEERSRIAKDLHDGLGGMLSGTKLSFMNMKENLVLTPENVILFDKSLSMLDNTIGDLRKVAHNLMPEALVKYGLVEALRDFCDTIQSSTNLKIVYQPLGENRKLSNTAEVFIYRIIQELVNNAVKHADAKQIIVQLTTSSNKIGITVEDDGKGFDTAITNRKGDGLDNIKYRVQYLNGTIDTVASPGNGTSVNIEVIA